MEQDERIQSKHSPHATLKDSRIDHRGNTSDRIDSQSDNEDDLTPPIALDSILQELISSERQSMMKDSQQPRPINRPRSDDFTSEQRQPLSSPPPPQRQQQQEHVSMIDPELLPPNWPKQVKYLIDYEYHPAISPSVLGLVQGRRRKKSEQHKDPGTMSTLTQWPQAHSVEDVQEVCEKNNDDTDEDEPDNEDRSWDEAEDEPNNEDGSRDEGEDEYDNLPIGHAISGLLRSRLQSTTNDNNDSSIVPLPPYEIRLIDSPLTHPVLGSYGLFATEPLRPGRHLLDYISLIVPDEYADPESDHTLYLCNDLNLDASAQGNHGRFVNDFRRIRTQQQGPNVAWDLYRDADTGEVRMGCKVLKRIQPGEEILCTYGKAYWKSRGIPVSGNEWEDTWDTDLEDWSENEVEQDKQAQQPK